MKEQPPNQDLGYVMHWTVPQTNEGMRLDTFLHILLPHLSLRQLRRALEDGAFRVNGGRVGKKGDAVIEGDVISYRGPATLLAAEVSPQFAANVVIVYEDASILVVEKPPGMPCHGFSGRETNSLANHLVAIRPGLKKIGKSPWEPGLVHRLDRETSGLIVVAKDEAAFGRLRAQFRSGLVQKKYWALVWGNTALEGTIDDPLTHDAKDRRKMKVLVNLADHPRVRKWAAFTRYRTAAQTGDVSLVEVEMVTGVMHQIRAHLAAIGHPLVGDSLYGPEQYLSLPFGRHFLHAFFLACRHPESGAVLSWESPLPQDLRAILQAVKILV
jgi:23S rRNA pseudouridine1911/1915/1917 synthase